MSIAYVYMSVQILLEATHIQALVACITGYMT